VIHACTPDFAAKLTLFADYLSGLSYLHDQKGVMHRDISPGNLAVVSFDKPKGIILDLDSATASESSTDHMQGTVPFLSPEIINLKAWKQEEEPPPPYGKSVDIWALRLNVYALYTDQPFSWGRFALSGARSTKLVTADLHEEFRRRLRQTIEAAEDSRAADFLRLIAGMTEFSAEDRISASTALVSALLLKGNEEGTIASKTGQKRPREE
jgi:serine/threonine protein kinase